MNPPERRDPLCISLNTRLAEFGRASLNLNVGCATTVLNLKCFGVLLVSAVGVWLFTTSHTPIQPSPSPVEAPIIPLRPAVQPASSTGAPLSLKLEHALKPNDIFKECNNCPELVVMPAGSFVMGSPDNEPDHVPSESPQHIGFCGRAAPPAALRATSTCVRSIGTAARP
jgi:hypothetical protein